MSQHIQFQIGSEFSGEGFKAAQNATASLNKDVKAAAGQAGQLASALGGMDNAVGNAARALSGMLNTFMTLNPVMIGITATISALTYAYNEHKKGAEELKKATDELNESLRKTNDASNAAFTDTVLSRIRDAQKDFERITKHANDMTAAMNGLANARAQGGVIAIQAEKLQAVMNEVTEEAKQLTAAEYDLRIATEKAAAGRERAQQQLTAAHQAVVDAEKRIEELDTQRMSALTAVKIMEERIAESKASGLAIEENDNKRLAALRAQIADIDAKIASAKEQLEVDVVKEQTAAANMANSTAAAQLEIDAAKGKIAELKDATAKAAEAERRAAEEKEAQAKKLKEQRDIQDEAAKIQKDVNAAAKEVADAERAYAAALAKYEANFAHNEMTNDILNGEKYGKGMAVPVRVEGKIMAEVQAKDLENAIKNGLVQNVRDMDKFIRENARARQREEQRNLNQLRNERQRYERLQNQSRKSWSKADADFAQKFEKLKEAAEAKKREVEDAKQRLAIAQQREKDNHQNLKDIKMKLERLGLR